MTTKEIISRLRKDPLDAWYYIQGTFRIYLYHNYRYFMRRHIVEQFEWRTTETPAKTCVANHSCLCCGCVTPDLMFADKACSADKDQWCIDQGLRECYPKMMNRKRWNKFNKNRTTIL